MCDDAPTDEPPPGAAPPPGIAPPPGAALLTAARRRHRPAACRARRAGPAAPRLAERIRLHGAGILDDGDCLAAVLGGNLERRGALARGLLQQAGALWGLSRLGIQELCALGLGRAEAARLAACLELGRRAAVQPAVGGRLREPSDAYRCVAPALAGAERERFVVVVLDVKNRPRRITVVAEGAVDLCPVDPREVFAPALRERGSALLVAHNHPSGDPEPSRADVELTRRLAAAGALLGIPVLDHLVVGAAGATPGYVSLAERGLLDGCARPAAGGWARGRDLAGIGSMP